MDTLGVVDRVSEGEEVVLTQRAERDAKALPEESEQMALVPDLEGQPGPQGLAQQALDGRPVAEGVSVGGHHDPRGAVGGGDGLAVLSTDALEQALAGVARVDLDEIRRRLARADLDVGEGAGAERHLLPDPDGLGRHALVEVAEEEVVAADALEEQAQLAGRRLPQWPDLTLAGGPRVRPETRVPPRERRMCP